MKEKIAGERKERSCATNLTLEEVQSMSHELTGGNDRTKVASTQLSKHRSDFAISTSFESLHGSSWGQTQVVRMCQRFCCFDWF
jgi:hypothetical protein